MDKKQQEWLRAVKRVTGHTFLCHITTADLSAAVAPYWTLKYLIAMIKEGKLEEALPLLEEAIEILNITRGDSYRTACDALLEEVLCFECAKSIANCECTDGFYLGDALKED